MPTLRIHTYGDEPTPKQYFEDIAWIREHRKSLIERYGKGYIIVHKGVVLGTGPSLREALSNAEKNAPDTLGDNTFVTWDTVSQTPVLNGLLRRKSQ